VPLDSLVLSLRNQFPGSSPLEWSAAAHQLGQHVARYVVHQEIETWLDRPVRPQDLVYCGLSPSDADGLLQPPQRGTYVDAWRHLEEVYLTAKHVLRPELDAQLHAEPAELPEGVDLGALQTLLFGPTFTTLEQATARLPTAGQLLEAHMRHLYDLQVRVLALQRMQEEGWTLLEVDEADETLLVRRNMGIIVFSTGEEATMPHTLAQLAALAGPSLQEAIARGATPLLALRQRWSAQGPCWEVDGAPQPPYAELAACLGQPDPKTLPWVSAVVDQVLAAVKGVAMPPWAACPQCASERVEIGRLERIPGMATLARSDQHGFPLGDGGHAQVIKRQPDKPIRVARVLLCRDCGGCRPFPEESLAALSVPRRMAGVSIPNGLAALLSYVAGRPLADDPLPSSLDHALRQMDPQGALQTRDVQLVYQAAVHLPEGLERLAQATASGLDGWREAVDRVRAGEPRVLAWELKSQESARTRKILALGLDVPSTMAFLQQVLGPVEQWSPLTEHTAWSGELLAAHELEVIVVHDVLGAPGPFAGDSTDLEILEGLLRSAHAVIWVGSETAWDDEGLTWAEEEGKLVALVGTEEQRAALPDRPGLAKLDLHAPDAFDQVARGITDRLDPEARQKAVALRDAVRTLQELMPPREVDEAFLTSRHTELALAALLTDDPAIWLDLLDEVFHTLVLEAGDMPSTPLRPALAARHLGELGILPIAMVNGLWELLEYEERAPGFASSLFHWLQPVLRPTPEPLTLARMKAIATRLPSLGHHVIHLMGLRNRLEQGEHPAIGRAVAELWWGVAAPTFSPAVARPLAGPLAEAAHVRGHRVVVIGTPDLSAGLRAARMVAGLYAPVQAELPDPNWDVPCIVVEPTAPSLVQLEQRARGGQLTVIITSTSATAWASALPPELLTGLDLTPGGSGDPPPPEAMIRAMMPHAPAEGIAELSSLMHTEQRPAGTIVVRPQDRLGGALWLRQGELLVDDRPHPPGAPLGLVRLFTGSRSGHTFHTTSDAIIDVLSREALDALQVAGSSIVPELERLAADEAVRRLLPAVVEASTAKGRKPEPAAPTWEAWWPPTPAPPFDRIPSHLVEERFPGAWVGTMAAGTVLYAPGEPSRALYLVLEGELQLLQPARAAVYGPGHVAGSLGFLSAGHPERCTASVDTVVMVWPTPLAQAQWADPASGLRRLVLHTLSSRL